MTFSAFKMRTKPGKLMLAFAIFMVSAFILPIDAAPQDVAAAATANSPTLTSNVVPANNTLSGNGAASTSSSDSSKAAGIENDADQKELPDGMSESLADFIINLLHGAAQNASKLAAHAISPTSAELPSSSNLPSSSSSLTSTNNGEGEDDDYYEDEYDDDYYGDEDFKSNTDSTQPTAQTKNISDIGCAVPVDLNNYCIVDDEVAFYFKDNTQLSGIRSTFINMDIVNRLKKSCPRGEWCLGNELETLKSMEENFYVGPMCAESMWDCIFSILVEREQCQDKEFMFVVDSADMLCQLFETEDEAETGSKCFAHVLAALHVTYADFLAQNMSMQPPAEAETTCDGSTFKMAKTYLCADNNCGRFFDAKLAMEKFRRWGWFMEKVDEIVENCDLDDVCGSLTSLPEESPGKKNWFDMTTPSFWAFDTSTYSSFWDDNDDEYEYEDDEYENIRNGANIGSNVASTAREEDETLMMALSVASAVGLLFMVLGLLFWRRSRRRNPYYYRTQEYGKTPPDAAHLLPYSEHDRDLD